MAEDLLDPATRYGFALFLWTAALFFALATVFMTLDYFRRR